MKRSILLDGELIEYELIIKKVKNINLRIHGDGRITVSANKRVPAKTIDRFLAEKSDFITKALKKVSKQETKKSFCDGEDLFLLGKAYKIKNETSKRNFVEIIEDGRAVIYTQNQSLEEKKKAVLALYSKICESEILKMCRDAYEGLESKPMDMPTVSFRKAKGRLGTCYPKSNKIILNKLLAAAPTECIEFVIYHEFIHFIHQNHSKNFYGELEKYVPNHKELKRRVSAFVAFD